MRCCWARRSARAGYIGLPARGLTLKLFPLGTGAYEARLKGASITPGYLADPEASATMFDDEGFLRLGDALRPADPSDLKQGFLFEGRLSKNFKLASGTWVSVNTLRVALLEAMEGLVRDAVIVGENRTAPGALLWLSEDGGALAPEARDGALREGLARAARVATGSASRVARAMVLPEPPSLARGEVTEKGNLNQRALRARHRELTARMHGADGDALIV